MLHTSHSAPFIVMNPNSVINLSQGVLHSQFLADRTNGRTIGTVYSVASVVICL